MSQRKQRKNKAQNKEHIVKYEGGNISQEKMIEIHAEAYYRALKRIKDENAESDEIKQEKKKYKWYENVFFVLNFLLWPWKISKRFRVSNQIYDSILVLFVSGVLKLVGGLMWLSGIFAIFYGIYQIVTAGVDNKVIDIYSFMGIMLALGSIIILAGKEFEKETDSNKIYAYSACIIALISCEVSIITVLRG